MYEPVSTTGRVIFITGALAFASLAYVLVLFLSGLALSEPANFPYRIGQVIGLAALPFIVASVVVIISALVVRMARGTRVSIVRLLWTGCLTVGIVTLFIVIGNHLKREQRVVAAECYSDPELMAAVMLRNLTAEAVQLEQCALKSGNVALTAKWETFLSRHRSRVQEQEVLAAQAYQRIYGTAWQERLGLDMQLVRAQALDTDFGGRTPAQCSAAYEAFFEGQSYLDDAKSWGGMFNAYRAQFDVQRRQVPRC